VTEADLISTIHWTEHIELTLNHPLKEVWTVFNDMRRWYPEYSIETVSGPSYETGPAFLEDQVLTVTSSKDFVRTANSEHEPGQPQPLTAKIIKVVPEKEIVCLLSGRAFDWENYTAFYIWKFSEKSGQTTIDVDQVGEAAFVSPLTKKEFAEYQNMLSDAFQLSWSNAFSNLTRVMDEGN
jgi:hypothetical protein